jgi:transposase
MVPPASSENVIYLALELSCSTWLVAARLPGAPKSILHRVAGGDTAGLLELIGSLRTRSAARCGTSVEVVTCFEAGRDGFWLHRLLTAQGIINHVVEPTSILVSRRARRAKTDRLDAEGLLRVLMSYWRGDRQICSVVRVPTPDEEDAKRQHREREHLVQERVRIENRIEALLVTQGIQRRPSLRSWERDLNALRTGDGRELPSHLRAELNRLHRRLVLTLELIREIEMERAESLAAEAKDATVCTITALARIRGIGENFATILTREVFYRAFDNRRQLASYVGVAPMPHQSGTMDRDRRIGRAGNPRARSTLIQLAWLWLRYQPGSALSVWYRERVGSLAGRTRRIAIVAMARKLLISLWRYTKNGLLPEGVELRA